MGIWKNQAKIWTSAAVAVWIAGGCQNPAAPEPTQKDWSNLEPANPEYVEPVREQEIEQKADEDPWWASYTVLVGEVRLAVYANEASAIKGEIMDTLGWCPVYTENGWRENNWPTNIGVKLPNNAWLYDNMGESGPAASRFWRYNVLGYDGMIIGTESETGCWRKHEISTAIKEPERRIPNYNGMGL